MKKLLLAALMLGFGGTAHAADKSVKEKVERYFMKNGVGDGDSNTVNSSKLKGAAKTKYEKLNGAKNCKSGGYCPEVYELNAYGTDVMVLYVTDDGGSYGYIYDTSGAHITDCSQGESDDMTCG